MKVNLIKKLSLLKSFNSTPSSEGFLMLFTFYTILKYDLPIGGSGRYIRHFLTKEKI